MPFLSGIPGGITRNLLKNIIVQLTAKPCTSVRFRAQPPIICKRNNK